MPIVCNVEQVRILRGRGAIQPGVNRCKLLSTKDFDILYKDCTTARYVAFSRLISVIRVVKYSLKLFLFSLSPF